MGAVFLQEKKRGKSQIASIKLIHEKTLKLDVILKF